MNVLSAIIKEIKTHHLMSLVTVKLMDDTIINTVLLETPETLTYLKRNNAVKILFKETEVILSKKKTEDSSLHNILTGTIKKVNRGELLARVEMELSIGTINAIITEQSFDRLNMKVGDAIFAGINATEIMLTV